MRMHFNIKSLISMMFAIVFSFVALFSFPVHAASPLITGSSSGSKTVAYTTTNNFNGYIFDYFTNFKTFFDENLEPGCFYKVDYDAFVTLQFRTAGILNSSDINFEFYKDNGSTPQRVNLIQQIEPITCATNTPYRLEDSGYIIIYADDVSHTYYAYQFNFNYGTTSNAAILSYQYNIQLNINEFIKLSDSEAEIYQRGFDAGYQDGETQGFNDGKGQGLTIGYENGYQQGQADSVGSGYDEGYQSGFNDGVDEGYQSGKDDGYDDGYDVGFEAGAGSVNTDQYYQSGFNAGVDSVDTDSFYAAGYEAGLNSGYQQAYDSGYAEGVSFGYSEGYAAARENVNQHLTNTGTSSGETFQVKYKVDENKNALTLTDSNTTLPVAFEYSYGEDYEFDYEREFENYDYESNSSDTEDYVSADSWGSYSDGYFDGGFGYEVSSRTEFDIIQNGSKIDETYFKELTKKFEKWRGYSYYYMAPVKLFTADTSAYAYKITLYQDSTTFTGKNINWIRNTVGEWSDIMSGESDLGLGFYNGSGGKFTYIIKTDNLPVDIYSALLMYFYCDQSNSASFDLVSNLTFDITPYTRNEFAGIMSNIDDLQGDINDRFGELEENLNQNFDDLMHSYDSSKGDLVNDNFQASLNEYETAENSLFNTATESLGAYEFFDFSSVPAMITGISFVTSVMTSIYTALGGVSGASGIILSILFSVMLVSMVLGLSRLYQSASRRSSHNNSSKPTRTKNDHIKK